MHVLPTYVYHMCMPVTHEGQKALEPLEQGYRWLLAATWVLGAS